MLIKIPTINRWSFNFMILFALLNLGCEKKSQSISFQIESQKSNIDHLIVSSYIIDTSIVWMSGTSSICLRTMDGGINWEAYSHPKIDTFQYRDIHAFNQDNVILLSVGKGKQSQIHQFNPSVGWQSLFVLDEDDGFLNSLEFWNDKIGLAYGDSFDGIPYVLKTEDGGITWTRIINLPASNEGEGGFASSGRCISVIRGGKAWIGTGGGGNARVLYTKNYGRSWRLFETPIVKREFSGITSVSFINNQIGFIAGGDLADVNSYTDNVAYTENAGRKWTKANRPQIPGPVYGSDICLFKDRLITAICGPNGLDLSLDKGDSWVNVSDENLWLADFTSHGIGWAAGKNGKILKIRFQ